MRIGDCDCDFLSARTGVPVVCCALLLVLALNVPAMGQSPAHSVCLDATTECHVEGSAVRVAVRLGFGSTLIAGAQMSLSYEPTKFKLISVLPGNSCDPESPFVNLIGRQINSITGEVFLAVTVDPNGIGAAARGPATLACFLLVPESNQSGDLCLLAGLSPQVTVLANQFGDSIPIDNSADCPSGNSDELSCQTIEVGASCTCPAGTVDCSHLDSTCGTGVCQSDPAPAKCAIDPQNEGQTCDDGQACTTNEVCESGHCVGENIGCPSLCLDIEDDCEYPSGLMTARVVVHPGVVPIAAAQFSVSYDPTRYTFVEMRPGGACDSSSPFAFQAAEQVNESLGEVFYSVSVNPFDLDSATLETTTLACITFRLAGPRRDEICLFSGNNPFTARLIDRDGESVPIYNGLICPTDQGPPIIACDLGCIPVPTTSDWGLVVLTLVLLVGAKVAFGIYRRPVGARAA
ncbi:MAG: hypothetical protein J5J06_18440 [Phycisphaerae bacterium]|nr:hypothetical protein [Phycisphaerae bacterium]